MRVNLVTNIALPGGFSIVADTPEDALILRIFTNDPRPIYIANSGGNIERNIQSMLITHVPATLPGHTVAAAIAKRLAEFDPGYRSNLCESRCVFCESVLPEHTADCLWQAARTLWHSAVQDA